MLDVYAVMLAEERSKEIGFNKEKSLRQLSCSSIFVFIYLFSTITKSIYPEVTLELILIFFLIKLFITINNRPNFNQYSIEIKISALFQFNFNHTMLKKHIFT